MRRRLLAISAAVSAAICLLFTVMWVRGFFATDVWASIRHNPAARLVDTHSIEATNGWIYVIKVSMLLPPGAVPSSQHPMDGTWAHEAGPPDSLQ